MSVTTARKHLQNATFELRDECQRPEGTCLALQQERKDERDRAIDAWVAARSKAALDKLTEAQVRPKVQLCDRCRVQELLDQALALLKLDRPLPGAEG